MNNEKFFKDTFNAQTPSFNNELIRSYEGKTSIFEV